jgi:hypothetical protein
MKICYFKLTILEHGGGLENYYIETASYLANKTDNEVDIITLDQKFTDNIERALSFYYFKKKVQNSKINENTKIIKKCC